MKYDIHPQESMKHPSSFQRTPPPGWHAGFTLVEMLGVMTIIGILATLTLLGLRGGNSATSRKAAVGNLMGVLDQARMIAISEGKPTYVVFVSAPKDQADLVTDTLPDTMWGRAYAVFVESDSTSATPFVPAQRSAWLYLPTGVAFKCDNSDVVQTKSVTSTPRFTPRSNPPDPTQFTIASRTDKTTRPLYLPYIRFDATGQVIDYSGELVSSDSPSLRLLLFQGTANNKSAETITSQSVNKTSGVKYALDEIRLKPTTGRAQYTLDPINNLATPAP